MTDEISYFRWDGFTGPLVRWDADTRTFSVTFPEGYWPVSDLDKIEVIVGADVMTRREAEIQSMQERFKYIASTGKFPDD